MLIAREIVCFLSFTSRALTTQVLPPPSATYFTIGRPIVRTLVLPLRCREIARKRVVFHSLLSPSSPNSPLGSHCHQFCFHHLKHHQHHHISETLHPYMTGPLRSNHYLTYHYHLPHVTPPYGFEVGESLRASTA